MLRWLRWMTIGYWALLSLLLLVPDPWALLGFVRPLGVGSARGVHLTAFLILGLLTSCWWPGRWRTGAMLLVGYAVAVELAQGLVPRRSVELKDLFENLAGLALGAGVCWAARRIRERGRQHPKRSAD